MGADVNNRARNGIPNLLHACSKSEEQEDFCIELIKAGADVNLIDEVKSRENNLINISSFIVYRKQNVQLYIMHVYLEMPKLSANFYVLKLIPMLWIVNNQHLLMKLLKEAISKFYQSYPLSVQNSMYTMFLVIILFTMVHHPMPVLPFDFWVNEVLLNCNRF